VAEAQTARQVGWHHHHPLDGQTVARTKHDDEQDRAGQGIVDEGQEQAYPNVTGQPMRGGHGPPSSSGSTVVWSSAVAGAGAGGPAAGWRGDIDSLEAACHLTRGGALLASSRLGVGLVCSASQPSAQHTPVCKRPLAVTVWPSPNHRPQPAPHPSNNHLHAQTRQRATLSASHTAPAPAHAPGPGGPRRLAAQNSPVVLRRHSSASCSASCSFKAFGAAVSAARPSRCFLEVSVCPVLSCPVLSVVLFVVVLVGLSAFGHLDMQACQS